MDNSHFVEDLCAEVEEQVKVFRLWLRCAFAKPAQPKQSDAITNPDSESFELIPSIVDFHPPFCPLRPPTYEHSVSNPR